MAGPYDNILATVGRTPVVRITKLAPPHVDLFVKLEAFNPMGSVKDRLALGIIEAAEASGALKPGQTVVEATSGNTGIGLAMVCAQKGYPLVVVMTETFSVERRKLMRFLGARVVLTPASERGSGMVAKAAELAAAHGWFLCRQFENEANPDFHSKTTAREIVADFADRRLDYWVTGYGTGGTVKGVARVLRRERPDTKIMVCEPDNAPLLASGFRQARAADGSPEESHPFFRPHVMQGWTPDFIAKLAEDAVDGELIDQVVPVSGTDALRLTHELACKEGIVTGVAGGATLAGALSIAETAPPGSAILCMLPDTGDRYLSTPLFDDVPVDMTVEEIEVSQSTPSHRFNGDSPSPCQPFTPPAPPTAAADAFVEQTINDPDAPVVVFALEWCELCWSVRKLFDRFDIPFVSIDLDSAPYKTENRGQDIRAALVAKTKSSDIPQIFVGGEHIGSYMETFEAFNEGRLRTMLMANGVTAPDPGGINAYSFLPTWLHPR